MSSAKSFFLSSVLALIPLLGICGDFTLCPVDIMTRVTGPIRTDVVSPVRISAWRNERVHIQFAFSSETGARGLRPSVSDFMSADGRGVASLPIRFRFVRGVSLRQDSGDVTTVPDVLDSVVSCDCPAGGYGAAWLTLSVPKLAVPGTYWAVFALEDDDGAKRTVPVDLQILDRTLPDVAERKFFLDMWFHPWSVAAYYGIRPYSEAHFSKLEPLYRELAAAGQKVILTSIVDMPWGEGYGSERAAIRGMVEYRKGRNGEFHADFSLFDRYVLFAKSCGIGPQIHCYTIVKFNDKHIFYYTDEASGERRAEELYEGTRTYEDFLMPLLVQLQEHLIEKGWIEDAYIAIDEVVPERLAKPRAFLKRVAPKLKFAVASNVEPMRYQEIERDIDVFSQILWTGHGITSVGTPVFDAFLENRRKAGRITTFYVCTAPKKPNTWLTSPLVETEWIGLYAAAKGFDGFLRWAYVFWNDDPFVETDIKHPGERTLVYPGCLSSVRWEILRDSIEDWEKIRVLRETSEISTVLKEALDDFDFLSLQQADEKTYRKAVLPVIRELNPIESSKRNVSAMGTDPAKSLKNKGF